MKSVFSVTSARRPALKRNQKEGVVVVLQRGGSTTAPWRRRFGAHPPSPVFLTAGISGRERVGSLGCAAQTGQVRARSAQPGGATSVPALPASRTGATRGRRGGGKFWAHERSTELSFPRLALPPAFSLKAWSSSFLYPWVCAYRGLLCELMGRL